MSGDTIRATWPGDIKLARVLMQKDGERGEYLVLDDEADVRLIHDDHPGHWVVCVDGDVVNVLDAHAYSNARDLANELVAHTTGQLHNPDNIGRGFQ